MATSEWLVPAGPDFQIHCPQQMDLSSGVITTPVYISKDQIPCYGNINENVVLIVKEMHIMYIEATPGTTDATYDFLISLGTNTSPSAMHDYTIPAGRSAGDVDIISQDDFSAESRLFKSGGVNWMQVRLNGGASGSGIVRVSLLVSQHYSEWKNA